MYGLQEINYFVKDWGVIYKDRVVPKNKYDTTHFSIWQRLIGNDATGLHKRAVDFLILEWLFDFDDTLWIRFVLPDNVTEESLREVYSPEVLENARKGLAKLLDTIPYDVLQMEIISDKGSYIKPFANKRNFLNYFSNTISESKKNELFEMISNGCVSEETIKKYIKNQKTDTRNGLPTTTKESPDFSHGECQ